MTTERWRVLVADDSEVCRALLREAIEAEGDLSVVGEASDGRAALEAVARLAPDLVTMDVRMPGMDGLATIGHLMARHPCPVLVVTGLPAGPADTLTFDAIRRGALDVVAKPAAGDVRAARELRRKIRRLAGVPVVRHLSPMPAPALRPVERHIRVVGLAASAGGPVALGTVLAALPARLPFPLAVVQHLPEGFTSSFARFLQGRTALEVRIAREPCGLDPSTIILAPDGAHLVARGDRLAPSSAPPVHGLRPSADLLFASLADVHRAHAAGFVLSGMGRDGAEGLLAMRRAGAATFAQDESTSVVFGMPRAAADAGAAERVIPLDAVAPALVALAGGQVR
ncbi:MAG TPA: chemotaxis-specific protein-glutamate methyltransferase CheB [Sandaracinaceae bacterium LLY-WYZ-13_1]|nr:chemotaxis-specific protein-glutamate methyltransferase CheB [Sandaracinaceae bacterium LLY-WYZ-13_1]